MAKKKKFHKTDHAQKAQWSAFKATNVKNLNLKGRKPNA